MRAAARADLSPRAAAFIIGIVGLPNKLISPGLKGHAQPWCIAVRFVYAVGI